MKTIKKFTKDKDLDYVRDYAKTNKISNYRIHINKDGSKELKQTIEQEIDNIKERLIALEKKVV